MKKFDWNGFAKGEFFVSTKNILELNDFVESYNKYLAENIISIRIEMEQELKENDWYFGILEGSFVVTGNICNETPITYWSEYMENESPKEEPEKEIKCEDEKSKNIRRTILESAISAVCGDREDKYGKPEKSFGEISKLWSAYLDIDLTGKDVAVMMCLFKIARIKTGTNKADNYIDLAGYAANAAELDGEQ